MRDKRLDNLRPPFKKGEVHNPNGRPKGAKGTSTVILDYFSKKMLGIDPITGEEKKLTVRQRVVLAQIGQALKGNTKAFKELVDRAEGKVAEKLEHSGADGAPLMPPTIVFEAQAEKEADA